MSALAARTRLRSHSGQSSIELAGTAGLLLLAALFAWQMALIGWTMVSTTNAVRTAARLYSRGASAADAQAAGTKSLTGELPTSGGTWTHSGDTWTLKVPIPILIPDVHLSGGMDVSRSATIPHTG